MRKTREILRLRHEVGLGVREVARSLRTSHGTVVNYLKRAQEAGISWPLPDSVDDTQLMELLKISSRPPERARRPLPDMAEVHKELRQRKCILGSGIVFGDLKEIGGCVSTFDRTSGSDREFSPFGRSYTLAPLLAS